MAPTDCLYHKEHLWVRREGANEAWIGMTDHAQENLGEVSYIEHPEAGNEIKEGVSFGTVESIKTTSDLIAPISGKILSVNEILSADPSHINRDPYREGWILKVRIGDIGELSKLMSAEQYEIQLNGG